jgi:hypothetical protein
LRSKSAALFGKTNEVSKIFPSAHSPAMNGGKTCVNSSPSQAFPQTSARLAQSAPNPVKNSRAAAAFRLCVLARAVRPES